MISPPARCREELQKPSRTRVERRRPQNFSWIFARVSSVSRLDAIYRRKGGVGGQPRWGGGLGARPHPGPRRGPTGMPGVCPGSVLLATAPSRYRNKSVKLASDSENISRIDFLKQKDSRKHELTLWHLVNRLVPENA